MTTPDTTCLFPQFAPSTAYRNGCRCPRCEQEKRQANARSYKKNRAKRRHKAKQYYVNHRQQIAEYSAAHKQEISLKNSKYHAQHRERINMRKQTWRDSPHGKALMQSRNAAYIQTPHGKAVSAAKSAKRRALKIKQTPKLNNIERQQMVAIYKRCQHLTESTGIPHHVDHRIPISKHGEHHPNNLQILTAEQNIKKGNRLP